MVAYKLHYFDIRGYAEAMRLMFAYAGQEFEDFQINREEWAKHKSNYFYGKVPALELVGEGKFLYQSSAILRYLAEQFGLAGKDAWERAKVNEIADFQKDAAAELHSYYFAAIGSKLITHHFIPDYRQGDKAALRKDLYVPVAARLFPAFVKLLKQSGSGFFAPSGLTFVDFVMAEWLDMFQQWAEPDLYKDYPELGQFVQKVYSLPQLKEQLDKRK